MGMNSTEGIWDYLKAKDNFVDLELLSDGNLARTLTTTFCNLDLVDSADVFLSDVMCSPGPCLGGAWSQLMILRSSR